MTAVAVASLDVLEVARDYIHFGNRSAGNAEKRFKSVFGMPSEHCKRLWRRLQCEGKLPLNADPKHLLWACFWLKQYSTERTMASFFSAHEDTIRKWVKLMVMAIAKLSLVSVVFAVMLDSPWIIAFIPSCRKGLLTLAWWTALKDKMAHEKIWRATRRGVLRNSRRY